LEQCDPRLIGLSQLGSWPSQTSFCTSAVTVQPTEQWVQMLLRISTGMPAFGGGPATALCRLPIDMVPIAASVPPAKPERRKNVRRFMAPEAVVSVSVNVLRRALRSAFLMSMGAFLSSDSC
jgi:hypothetical protein